MRIGLSRDEQVRVLAAAEAWKGTPFHPDARIRGVGVDCANLLVGIFSDAGVLEPFAIAPSPTGWHLHTPDERYLRGVAERAVRIGPPHEVGDVLIFRGARWPSAGHGGVYIGGDRVVHVLTDGRVEAWSLSRTMLAATFDSAWRLVRPDE